MKSEKQSSSNILGVGGSVVASKQNRPPRSTLKGSAIFPNNKNNDVIRTEADSIVLGWDPSNPEPLPVIPQNVMPTRRRNKRSYSDMPYDWHFYRATGKTLDQYEALSDSDIRYFIERNIPTPRKGLTESDEEINTLRYGSPGGADDGLVRLNDTRFSPLSTLLQYTYTDWTFEGFLESAIGDYLFRNFLVIYCMWFYLYFTEYLYVTLSLYFPIFDFFFAYDLFLWDTYTNFYFTRLALSLYLPLLAIFLYFEISSGLSSKYDFALGSLGFGSFILSLFLYTYTGFAPFITSALSICVVFFLYVFYYFVPRAIVYQRISPPVFLPAPFSVGQLYLPKYCYRFDFSKLEASRPSTIICSKRNNFTRFPFHSNSLRSVLADIRLVAFVNSYSKVVIGSRYIPVQSREPLFGGGPTSFYNVNPKDLYASREQQELPLGVLFTAPIMDNSICLDEEEMYLTTHTYLKPLATSNTHFFSSGYRRSVLSLYKRHFTSEYDTFDFHFSPRLPLWQQNLLADPYYNLYVWLKYLNPKKARPKSIYANIYSIDIYKPADSPYPIFDYFLAFFYSLIERLFDRITLYYFYKIPDAFSFKKMYSLLVFFDKSSLFFVSPNAYYQLAKFLFRVERKLLIDLHSIKILSTSPAARFELIAFLSSLHDFLEMKFASKYSRYFITARSRLFIRLSLRFINRVLLTLSRLNNYISKYAYLVNKPYS